MYKLEKINKKRFTYRDVMDVFQIKDYTILAWVLREWENNGVIAPIKNSGLTSFTPQIQMEYKKLESKPDYYDMIPKIRRLHPDLDIGRYLKRPEVYAENRKGIEQLNDYLWENKADLKYSVSVNERSFAIWRDEKYLESSKGAAICSWNKLDYCYLNCFKAPEPYFFTDFRENVNDSVNVLIIENKDTWYTIGKALRQSVNKTLLGYKIGLLVYGEGNKIRKRNLSIKEFLDDILCPGYHVLYTGDIDIAGLDLFFGLIQTIPDIKAELFLPLYKMMLSKKHPNKVFYPQVLNRCLEYNRMFLEHFTAEDKEFIKNILDNNKRIPQEVLNYQDYLRFVQ